MSYPPMIWGLENTSVKAHIYLDVTANRPRPACKLVVSRCDRANSDSLLLTRCRCSQEIRPGFGGRGREEGWGRRCQSLTV